MLKKISKKKGYGKNKTIKTILKFFDTVFRSEIVLVHGHKMKLPNHGFSAYSTHGIYGELDTKTVEKFIEQGDYVIDVGAAIGYYTLILARKVGNNGKVYAFEPKKDRFELLKHNTELNGYKNVVLENKAILPTDTKSVFFKSKRSLGGLKFITNEVQSEELQVVSDIQSVDLDTFLHNVNIKRQISFMKIDVDGPELLVLKSASEILKNKNLKILLEWDIDTSRKSGCEPKEIIDILKENAFDIYFPDYANNKYHLIKGEELVNLKSQNTINLFCIKSENSEKFRIPV